MIGALVFKGNDRGALIYCCIKTTDQNVRNKMEQMVECTRFYNIDSSLTLFQWYRVLI